MSTKSKILFSLLCLFICLSNQNAAAEPATRDPWLQPFSSDSIWNTPIGSLAKFSDKDDPITQDILRDEARINAGQWSHPLYRALPDSPMTVVYDTENKRQYTVRIPAEATPAPPFPKGDHHMYVVDPEARYVLEMFGAVRQPDGRIKAVRTEYIDLRGTGTHLHDVRFPGVRASNSSGMGGIIRKWEIAAHKISHAMTFMLPTTQLKHGPVWPFEREDYWGFRDYKGNVPIGTLIAIPPDVDISKLGLTPSGYALAEALQNYGAYCADTGGFRHIIMSAEQAAEGMPELNDMRKDFNIIHKYLRVVLNNTPSTPGGGGAARVAPLPPLVP